jgi:hypothetical protein
MDVGEPPELTWFVDRALGRGAIPTALRALGVPVELHDDHFAQDAQDVEWIPRVSARRWAILTKDRNIKHNTLEIDTVLSSKACYVCLRGKGLVSAKAAARITQAFPRFDGIARACSWPVLMRVTQSSVLVVENDCWTESRKQHTNPKYWRRLKY